MTAQGHHTAQMTRNNTFENQSQKRSYRKSKVSPRGEKMSKTIYEKLDKINKKFDSKLNDAISQSRSKLKATSKSVKAETVSTKAKKVSKLDLSKIQKAQRNINDSS